MESKPLKILAVDHHPVNLVTLKAVVADNFPGATVQVALNGSGVLKWVREDEPDVILVDMGRPCKDGFEVCRKLKADEQLREIPVVFLTTERTGREVRAKALEAGAEAFLSKPLDAVELTAQLRAMAKIKAAVNRERREKERLAQVVAERTRELEHELAERRQAEQRLRLANREFELSKTAALNLLEQSRQLEAERQKARADYQTLFNEMRDGFALHEILCDGEGRPIDYRFLSANPAFEKLTGLEARKVVGRRVREVLPKLEPFWIETYGRVALTGNPASFEHYEPGIGRHFEVTAYCPARGQFACVFVDVTERKLAEESTRRNQAELEAIYENTPLMMCLVNEERQVERINRTMAEAVGCARTINTPLGPGELLGCINALNDPRGCGFGAACTPCPLRVAMANTLETGQTHRHVEATMKLARGGVRRDLQVSASTARVRLQNKPKVLVCLEDVTSHRQLQAQFLQAQKMEAIGQLAGGLAHDFNNILAAIMMNLGLLQANRQLDGAVAQPLKELMAEAERAAGLTRQLLLFSRRSRLEVKALDLNEVVANLLKMLGRLISEDIDLQFQRKTGLPAVEADAGMLEQVLMNLCVNARDAMPKGGRISISTDAVKMNGENTSEHPQRRPGAFVCLSVTDTGCGMDELTLHRIFEPFFTTKAPGKGTGLGLATVHGIVAQHHGWVEVQSQPGRGTTFRVFLPASAKSVEAVAENRSLEAAKGHETILLAEDDPGVRRIVVQTLRVFGYRVLEAADGREALKLWQKHGDEVNLLFSDMVMSEGLTGLDLAEKLQAEKPGLKVIISSGYSATLPQSAQARARGIFYLPKPYQVSVLGRKVRECLDR